MKTTHKNKFRWAIRFLALGILIYVALYSIERVAFQVNNEETMMHNQYYRELANQCQKKESKSCCMVSLRRMTARGARIMPMKGCPKGYREDSIKCPDSYHWCELDGSEAKTGRIKSDKS